LHNVFHNTVEIFAASMVACVRWLDEVDGSNSQKGCSTDSDLDVPALW